MSDDDLDPDHVTDPYDPDEPDEPDDDDGDD